MNIEELKTKIKAVVNDTISQQIYFVLRKEDSFVLRLADIEDEKAAPELEGMFVDYISDAILDKSDLQLCELSIDDERANTIYHYDYDSFPEELEIFKNFDITNALARIPKFNFSTDDLSDLFGYIIYLGNMQNGILLFKKHYAIALIKRDSFLLGIKRSSQRFEKVSGEEMVRMNGTTQLIRVDGELYVMDIKMLERNMGFHQLIQKAAEQTVDAVEKLGILENAEILRETIEETSFARKLSKVKQTSPIFKNNIPKETIIQFTKNTPELSGKFKYSEDGSAIRLDSKKSKDAFVKLMNDSFLRSELTKLCYDVSTKDQLVAEE